jgi:hypothetical protein
VRVTGSSCERQPPIPVVESTDRYPYRGDASARTLLRACDNFSCPQAPVGFGGRPTLHDALPRVAPGHIGPSEQPRGFE